jgi:hypothetical protein
MYEYRHPYNGSGHSIIQQQRWRDPVLEGLGSTVSSRVGHICVSFVYLKNDRLTIACIRNPECSCVLALYIKMLAMWRTVFYWSLEFLVHQLWVMYKLMRFLFRLALALSYLYLLHCVHSIVHCHIAVVWGGGGNGDSDMLVISSSMKIGLQELVLLVKHVVMKSCDSSVGVATRLWVGWLG